jgi:membrane associated rhomboid family serine protease
VGHMDAVLLIIGASTFAFTQLHEIVSRFGLIPAQAMRSGGLTFLTSFFLHAGVLHLVGNIYFLFVFGNDVENFLRPLRYFTLVALAAFIGDLAHIAADPSSQIPCVGASGGIAGVITFYALNFPEVKLGFLLRYGWWWFRWIRLPGLVCICSMDSISSRRRLGTSRRHQRCIFACPYWRSGRGFCGLAALAEDQSSDRGFSPVTFPRIQLSSFGH